MAEISKNFKIGKGTFTPGKSVLNNNLGTWEGTGDPVTLKQLMDRPNYYASKLLEIEKEAYTQRQLDKGMAPQDIPKFTARKNPGKKDLSKGSISTTIESDNSIITKNGVKDIDSFRSPDLTKNSFISNYVIDFSNTESTKKYLEDQNNEPSSTYRNDFSPYNKYTDATYQLRWTNPDTNEVKTSRPIKYWYTTEEIQYIVDEDLISGVSGYNVSSLGNINQHVWGPFSFQARSKGERNFFEVIDQDPSDIFLSKTHGFSSESSYGNFTLRFEPQNVPPISGQLLIRNRKRASNLDNGIFTEAEIDLFHYSPTLGDSLKSNNVSGYLPIPSLNLDNPAVPDIEIFDCPAVASDKSFEYIKDVRATNLFRNFNFLFKDPPNPELTEVPLYITGIHSFIDQATIPSISPKVPIHFPINIDTDGTEYNAENYFAWGAPNKFIGHSVFAPYYVSIKNCDTITGFRVPVQNIQTTQSHLSRLNITNCPNLTYFSAPTVAFNQCTGINLSGCNIDTFNLYHFFNKKNLGFYLVPDEQGNPQYNEEGNPLFNFAGDPLKRYPKNLEIPRPKGMSIPFHETDLIESTLNVDLPLADSNVPAAFLSNKLQYINLYGNNLNQTGCLAVINSALQSYLLQKGVEPILDIRNQKPRNGPQSAIFTDFRGNLYGDFVPQNPEYPFTRPILDVNDQCISGIRQLERRGWTVKYDS